VTLLPGVVVAMILLPFAAASAQSRPVTDLKNVPPTQQVVSVAFCRAGYNVSLRDGSTRRFNEYDVAFKTDSSANGPRPAKPALVPTGRVGDRAFVVFADVDELGQSVRAACPD
jgi:cytochrome c